MENLTLCSVKTAEFVAFLNTVENVCLSTFVDFSLLLNQLSSSRQWTMSFLDTKEETHHPRPPDSKTISSCRFMAKNVKREIDAGNFDQHTHKIVSMTSPNIDSPSPTYARIKFRRDKNLSYNPLYERQICIRFADMVRFHCLTSPPTSSPPPPAPSTPFPSPRLFGCTVIFSEAKKQLPSVKGKVLRPEHVNSGFSHRNSTDEMCIFRLEELSKVICHESLHLLGDDGFLDDNDTASIQDKIMQTFRIRCFHRDSEPSFCSLNISEAFTETWATILNVLLLKRDHGMDACWAFNVEKEFCFFQCAKILDHFEFPSFSSFYRRHLVNNPLSGRWLLQEASVVSYFFLRSVLLHSIDDFLFTLKSPSQQLQLTVFDRVNFLERLVQTTWLEETTTLHRDYCAKVDVYINLLRCPNTPFLTKGIRRSLRMTIVEAILSG